MSSSVSTPSLDAGPSCPMTSFPPSINHTSVSISSQPRAMALSKEAMVFSGACAFAPRWPIRRIDATVVRTGAQFLDEVPDLRDGADAVRLGAPHPVRPLRIGG